LVDEITIEVYGSIYKKKAEYVRASFSSTTGINRGFYEYHYTKSCRTKAAGSMEPSWLTEELGDYNFYASLLEEYSIYEKY